MITNTSAVTLAAKIRNDVSCQACKNMPATIMIGSAANMPTDSSDSLPVMLPMIAHRTTTPMPTSSVTSDPIVTSPPASTAFGLTCGTYQPPRNNVVATPEITNRLTHSTIG